MRSARRIYAEENLETGEPDPVPQEIPPQPDLVKGSLWMLGITLLLFFLPVINGVVGGLVGGFKVGGTKNAIVASILPAMAALCGLWMLLTIVGLPSSFGYITDIVRTSLVVLAVLAMIVGAAIGGTVAQNRFDRLNRA